MANNLPSLQHYYKCKETHQVISIVSIDQNQSLPIIKYQYLNQITTEGTCPTLECSDTQFESLFSDYNP